MNDSLAHRGPDASGIYTDELFCLGHRRLSILDLSAHGNQPFTSSDGHYIMVYNGEVYNFQELASELNFIPKTGTDTEVVLEAYVRYGDDFVSKLNGMFSIAIYHKESGELKIWRDRIGIKPLYYYWDGKHFAFASELKSLFMLPFSKEINEEALKDFLFLEYIPQPKTILNNFYKLGHGSVLTFKKGQLSIARYYSLRDKIHSPLALSEKDALVKFEELFYSSVRYRIKADVPVGTFLSGGIDSASICTALKENKVNLTSFNVAFEKAEFDESGFAREIAESLGSALSNYKLGPNDLLDLRKNITYSYDEPFAVSSVFPTYKVCQLAARNIKVALSGDGGDELFMGYGHYNWMKRLSMIDSFGGKNIRSVLSCIAKEMSPRIARTAGIFDYDTLEKDWPHIWSQEQYMFSERQISDLMGGAYHNIQLRDSWRDICKKTPDKFQRVSLFDLDHYLPDDLLYKVDIASMANGLEVRLPFLDHRLVEFALNLPTGLKIKNNHQKYLLKKYLSTYLKPELINRKKWGFSAPIKNWLSDELKEYAAQMLDPVELKKEGLFYDKEVSKLLEEFNSGKTYLNKKLWAIIVFREWKKNYLGE